MKKIKIQFIGTFIYYKLVNLDSIETDYFRSIAYRLGLTLEQAIIDPFFYHSLRLDKYQSYQDLNGVSYFGLDINSFHQIEVFVNGHKKQKFSYFDLNPENVLFPLYASSITFPIILNNQIVIRTKEKGTVKYTFQNQLEKPLDEIISFNLSKLEIEFLLSGIQLQEKKLTINRTDTVVIEQFVFT